MIIFPKSSLFICLFLICLGNSYAQDLSAIKKSTDLTNNSSLTIHPFDDGLNSSSFPMHFTFLMAGTTTAFLLDNSVREYLINNPTNNETFLIKVGHTYGDFYYNLYFSSGMLLTGYILGNKRLAITGKSLVESLLLSSLASISLKFIFGRSRPYREEGNLKFNFFESDNQKNSLPSGHVIIGSTASTILSKAIDNTYFSILLYGISGLTVYQRLSTDNHWFSDVFLGSLIGHFIGDYIYDKNFEKLSEGNMPSIVPFLYQDNMGVNLIYIF